MLNLTLLKSNLKSNYKVFLIIAAVLLMYISIIVMMYDPETNESLIQMLAMFPQELIGAFGFSTVAGTLTEFLSSYLYGFIFLIFPLILEMVVAHRMIARHVDRGSMAYILSTPIGRKNVAITQFLFLEFVTLLMIVYISIVTVVSSELAFPGMLKIGTVLYLNVGLFLLHSAIASICFFASCIANEAKTSLSIGVGISVAFYILQMLGNMGEKLKFFQYLTIFTLFQPSEVVAGSDSVPLYYGILTLIAALFYVVGIRQFVKRDLPL